MSLDSVELVMMGEEPFGISIPNDDASTLVTVVHHRTIGCCTRLDPGNRGARGIFGMLHVVVGLKIQPKLNKTYAPLITDAEAVLSLAVALQGFEPITGWCCRMSREQAACRDARDLRQRCATSPSLDCSCRIAACSSCLRSFNSASCFCISSCCRLRSRISVA
jgi:hypothetical protein